jgi:hypothetical protein
MKGYTQRREDLTGVKGCEVIKHFIVIDKIKPKSAQFKEVVMLNRLNHEMARHAALCTLTEIENVSYRAASVCQRQLLYNLYGGSVFTNQKNPTSLWKFKEKWLCGRSRDRAKLLPSTFH